MHHLKRWLDRAVEVSRLLTQILLGVLVLFIVLDVILRYFFNNPLVYTPEVVQLVLSLVVFLGIVSCTALQGHIAINLFVDRLSKLTQTYISCFISLLCTGLFIVITWRMFAYMMLVRQMGIETVILQIPQYLVILVIAFCCILTALLLLSQFIYYIGKSISK